MNSSLAKNKEGYFVRKLGNPEEWLNNTLAKYHEIPIELVRREFKTKNNSLSWWFIPDITHDSLKKIAASIISVYNNPEMLPIELLIIPAKDFTNMHMEQSESDAYTAINSMKQSHFNMCKINIGRMVSLCKMTAGVIDTNNIKRVQFDDAFATLKLIDQDTKEQTGKMGTWIKERLIKERENKNTKKT